jgi:hypothetical protein
MDKQSGHRETIAELLDGLGTVGLFMLGEVRAALRKGVSSKAEFMETLDKTVRIMKQSGKMAVEDIERAATKLRDSWEILDAQGNEDWNKFLDDVRSRMQKLGDVSQETFNLCVDFGKKRLHENWEAGGRLGEEQLKFMEKQAQEMSGFLKSNWGVFQDHLKDAGDRMERSFNAAWEELSKKKKD